MSGDLILDKDTTYPIDMMIIKRGDEFILKKMIINGEVLQTKKIDFPLDRWLEENSSNQDTILIERCAPLESEIQNFFMMQTLLKLNSPTDSVEFRGVK